MVEENDGKIPINVAENIANEYDQDQVIILAWNKETKMQHVTTFGKSQVESKEAARGGNTLKKYLGWPDVLCHSEPEPKVDADPDVDIMYKALREISDAKYDDGEVAGEAFRLANIAQEAIKEMTGKNDTSK